MRRYDHIKLLVVVLLIMGLGSLPEVVEAQCSMCKAVAETATSDNGGVPSKGLNDGIVYLMGIPYLLLIFLFLVFFRKRLKGFFKELLAT